MFRRQPERTFAKIEPVYQVIRKLFDRYGVKMLITIFTCVSRWWPGAERETPWKDLLRLRRRDDGRHFDLTAEYAKKVSTRLPREIGGWKEVLRDYRASELFQFHQRFDERFYTSRKGPAFDFDAVIREMPPCFSRALQNPNDSLLKSVFLQGIIRILEKKNWHPKDIG